MGVAPRFGPALGPRVWTFSPIPMVCFGTSRTVFTERLGRRFWKVALDRSSDGGPLAPGGPTVEQLLRPAGRVNFPRLALKHCTMRHGGEGGAVKGRRSRDRWDDLCSFKGMLWIGREW